MEATFFFSNSIKPAIFFYSTCNYKSTKLIETILRVLHVFLEKNFTILPFVNRTQIWKIDKKYDKNFNVNYHILGIDLNIVYHYFDIEITK